MYAWAYLAENFLGHIGVEVTQNNSHVFFLQAYNLHIGLNQLWR